MKDFETRLRDISEFQKKETQKQATEITQLSQQTTRLQSDIMQNCRELVIAGRKASELLPEWKEKRDKAGNDIQIQEKAEGRIYKNESRQRLRKKIQEETDHRQQ